MIPTYTLDQIISAETGNRYVPHRLMDMPRYVYEGDHRYACPECYAPVRNNGGDGRCLMCLHDKTLLPVNYRRTPQRSKEEDD